MRRSRVRSLVTSALLVALLAASAWVTLPLGAVPVTLQTLVVLLIALVCTPAQAAVTVGAYLLLGAAGVPVFSSVQGGVSSLAGPTGGYLLGFALGATLGALVVRPASARRGPDTPTTAYGPTVHRQAHVPQDRRFTGTPGMHDDPGGRPARNVLADGAAAAAALVAIYALGTLWLAHSTGLTVGRAVVVGVVPFLPLDAAKAAAAIAVAAALRRAGVA